MSGPGFNDTTEKPTTSNSVTKSGYGVPTAVVPDFVGQIYYDITNKVLYGANGVSAGNWDTINSVSGAVAYTFPEVLTKAFLGLTVDDTGFEAMAVYGGNLYIGTTNTVAATDATAAKILKYDGTTWTIITKATMGAHANDAGFISMGVFNNKLYIGTYNTTSATDSTAAKILIYDGSTWSVVTKATMGAHANDIRLYGGTVYLSKIYFGTYNNTSATDNTSAKLITHDGSSWAIITKATMGGTNADYSLKAGEVYGGKLYWGTFNTTSATDSTAAKILIYDGSTWSVVTKATMGAVDTDFYLPSLCTFNNKLYIGTGNATAAVDSTAAKLIRYNGSTWVVITKQQTGGVTGDTYFYKLIVYQNRLYVFSYNTVLATDATAAKTMILDIGWTRLLKSFFGAENSDTSFYGAAIFNNKLYIGTTNALGVTDITGAKIVIL